MSPSSRCIFGWASANPTGDHVPPPAANGSHFTFKVAPQEAGPSSPPPQPPPPPRRPPSATKIPRPPNPFIIFRSRFTRLYHSPQTSKQRRATAAARNEGSASTVSRNAADAWHRLPDAEKETYYVLAQLEKERHAREHPGYQYRPRRRAQAHGHRHGAPAPQPQPESTSGAQTPSPDADTEQPPSSPEFSPPASAPVDPAVKVDHRRSSSVPVTLGEHGTYLSSLAFGGGTPGVTGAEGWPSESFKWTPVPTPVPALAGRMQAKRRSRSLTQAEWSSLGASLNSYAPAEPPLLFHPHSPQATLFQSSPPFLVQSSHQRYPQDDDDDALARDQALAFDPAALYAHSQIQVQAQQMHMSPLAAVASSLANWNGGPAGAGATPDNSPGTGVIAPMALPAVPTLPTWLADASDVPATPPDEYDAPTAGPEFSASHCMDFCWPLPLDATAQYVSGFEAGAGAGADACAAAALQEYELGLQARGVHSYGDGSPGSEDFASYFTHGALDFDDSGLELQTQYFAQAAPR